MRIGAMKKQSQFKKRAKMDVTSATTVNYINELRTTNYELIMKTKPNKANFKRDDGFSAYYTRDCHGRPKLKSGMYMEPMLPGTIMYVYFGAGLRSLADVAAGNVEKGTAGRVFFWLGLVATIAVTVFVTRVARNALKHAVPQTSAETTKIE